MTTRQNALAVMLLGGLFAFAPIAAGETLAGTLRLEDVVDEARRANAEIRAARERQSAAAAVPARVSAYDDPTFSYESWNAPESFRLDRADNNILRLSQKVPFPGKRRLAGEAAERDAERARESATRAELDVVAAVKRAYYDLWRAYQNMQIYSRDQELVERLVQTVEQRYRVGEGAQPDVLRAQVELTRALNRLTTERLAVDSARAGLAALLSREDDTGLGVPEDPPSPSLEAPLDELVARALRERPDLRAATASIAGEETKVTMAKLDYFPDFEFSIARFINFANRDGFGAMASVSIPFLFKRKYDAAVTEANAHVAESRAERRRLEDRARRNVKQAYLRARTALLQNELFLTAHVPQSEQALEAAEVGYRTGKIDFLSLLDSLRAVEMVHVEHITAAAEFWKAMADLERAVGGELSQKRVTQ
jgi:outer membrane protein, heavy metal efflux system